MILASASIQNPAYVPTSYQTFLLTVLLMLIHGCMASMPTRWIARVNSAGSTFNIIALIVVLIVIPSGELSLRRRTGTREADNVDSNGPSVTWLDEVQSFERSLG